MCFQHELISRSCERQLINLELWVINVYADYFNYEFPIYIETVCSAARRFSSFSICFNLICNEFIANLRFGHAVQVYQI